LRCRRPAPRGRLVAARDPPRAPRRPLAASRGSLPTSRRRVLGPRGPLRASRHPVVTTRLDGVQACKRPRTRATNADRWRQRGR
jgi:hypothetical protein